MKRGEEWKVQPASGAQLVLLRKKRPDIPERILQGLSKGEASFLIDADRRKKRARDYSEVA